MKVKNPFILTSLTLMMLLSICSVAAAQDAEPATPTETLETEAVVEEAAETITEATIEEPVQETPPPAPATPTTSITHANHHPNVFIVPLGGEMNLKVGYEHPMDFENANYIESIKMEKLNGDFLGLKQFRSRDTQAFAEFLVNPKLADFSEVVLIARSTKLGDIRSIQKLEFTPEDQLPDQFNPKKQRELAMKAFKERVAKRDNNPAAAPKKVEKKIVEKVEKVVKEEVKVEEKVATKAPAVEEAVKEEPKKKKKKGWLW